MILTYLLYPEWWNTLTIQTQKKFIDSTKNTKIRFYIFDKYWILAGQVNFTNFVPAGQHQVSTGLEIGSGACVSSRNSGYNTPARHGPMVSNNKAGICCVINSTMGRGVWRGLWAEKEQIFRPGSWSIPERLEDQHLPSRGGMQGICCIIYHQFAKRKIGVKGRSLHQAIKSISSAAEKAVTGSGSSIRTPSGQQGRDRWYVVRLRPDSGRRTLLPCRAHQGYRGYGMEGGVPGMLGTTLSLLEMLWASINETSMKQGAHLMTLMTCLTLLLTTPHRLLLSRVFY